MKHIMPMMALPFKKLLDGSKKIDVRLYNEKCQKIRPNDIVEFECADINDKVLCLVKGFVVFESADEMAALLPPEVFGYDDKEEVRVRLNRLFLYEDQQKYGVIGIFLDCLDERVRNIDRDSLAHDEPDAPEISFTPVAREISPEKTMLNQSGNSR